MNQIKNILITGANGQLGRELLDLLSSKDQYNVIPTDVAELDITNSDAVDSFINENAVDYIVNCAAYTAVDRAEADEATAKIINADAVGNLACAANRKGARMVHISTDYVFDGENCRPYCENDSVNPVSAYGRTKLAGEHELMTATNGNGIIIRTAWLYSPHGKNFVKTMMELGRSREQLKVVFDQVGSPTYARDLAAAIIAIIDASEWMPGIYHYSNEGVISWYDFTKAIHRLAGITTCNVYPCHSSDYLTPAHRPSYSVLDKTKIKQTFGITVPYWEDSLKHCISRLMNE
ncbi:MAG: dTDP-4-dehydrorhamnose reductase [Muribaculaceae bacterium]|nr:dTDP-4-dehydrorhamnose reductase [Muribaculaceae bacterium]